MCQESCEQGYADPTNPTTSPRPKADLRKINNCSCPNICTKGLGSWTLDSCKQSGQTMEFQYWTSNVGTTSSVELSFHPAFLSFWELGRCWCLTNASRYLCWENSGLAAALLVISSRMCLQLGLHMFVFDKVFLYACRGEGWNGRERVSWSSWEGRRKRATWL